ncbi:hypothetical protein KEM52_000821 [Ascosphaera acerosa]|nr:hypothetical protein KEM52_000821 [Ascosphaera acerosa]
MEKVLHQTQAVTMPNGTLTAASLAAATPTSTGNYIDRYELLKVSREQERVQAIATGQMTNPDERTSLSQAITPVGTCTDMCPEFERVERVVQKMVDRPEKLDDAETQLSTERRMVKRFRRSAAGYDEQLPSDIRTPSALLQTVNYLLRHIISPDESSLGLMHKFIWDRTRGVRNDLSIQQLTQTEDVKLAVKCLERIARFHILSLHLLTSPDNTEHFDHHQEREQLNNTLISLIYYYDDNQNQLSFPNESEFRAYYIIFSISDQRPDLESRVQRWPRSLLQSSRVRLALDLYAAACNTWDYQGVLDAKRASPVAQNNFDRFFSLIESPSTSYLTACVAEIYFGQVRQTAIRSIWKAYCRQPMSQQHRNREWSLSELTSALYFDDDQQTLDFCQNQGLSFDSDDGSQMFLSWGQQSLDVDFQPSSEQIFSRRLVEAKRGGRNLVALILGMSVRQAAKYGALHPESLQQATVSHASHANESLFVEGSDGPEQHQLLLVPSDEDASPFMYSAAAPTLGPQGLSSGIPQSTSNLRQPSSSISPLEEQTVQFSGGKPFVNPFGRLAASSSQSLSMFALWRQSYLIAKYDASSKSRSRRVGKQKRSSVHWRARRRPRKQRNAS